MPDSNFDSAYQDLVKETTARVKKNEPLSNHTTYRIGGPAKLFIEVNDISSLATSLEILERSQIKWTFLGRGSNILASDKGYEGALLILGPEFRKHVVKDDTLIVAGAGAVLGTIVRDAFHKGLSGLEFAVGIPGTLGGALVMNAGDRYEWIGSIVDTVTVFSTKEGIKQYEADEIQWGYRSSDLAQKGIIIESCLRVKPGDVASIRASMEARLRKRKASQPLSLPNAGSVFKNPPEGSVGGLIESCGLKGHRIGGAQISDIHANFIVNVENASAGDVIDLIVLARNTVKKEHNVELRTEIKFLGEF